MIQQFNRWSKSTTIKLCGSVLRTRLWSCPGAMDLQFSSAGLSIEPPPARTVIKWSCVDSWEKSWAWKMESRYSFTVSCLFFALFHTRMLHNDTSWQSCDSLNSQLLLRLTRCLHWLTGSVVSLRVFWDHVTRSHQCTKCLWSLWLLMTGKSWWVSTVTRIFYSSNSDAL